MGADIVEEGRASHGGEPVADLVVRHAPLRGIEVPVELVPDMIDEFPILAIAAACARGTTVVRGAAELRVKESDRIAAMATGLRSLGVHVEERPDGALIEGGTLRGGAIDSLRSEEHTSELQSLMRTSYAVFCLKKKKKNSNK